MSIFPTINYQNGASMKIGTHYDWFKGDGTVTSHVYLTPLTRTGSMPINGRHRRNKDGTYSSGGPWIMCKEVTTHYPAGGARYRRGYPSISYSGYAFIMTDLGPPASMPTDWNSTASLQSRFSMVGGKGAEAWSRMRPDKPSFSAATSLLELKDIVAPLKQGLKNLISKVEYEKSLRRANRMSEHQRVGNRHLEVQFGYLPLLSDIQNFVEAFDKRHKAFDDMLRNESKPVIRRTTFGGKYDKQNYVTTHTPRPGNLNTNFVGQVGPIGLTQEYEPINGNLTRTQKSSTEETWWAEGRFRYLLPPGPRTDAWKRSMVKRIMGGRITPSTLYNLIPWSWLVDYFTDVGQMMEAISPGVADLLICDYAYVMATFRWSHHYTDESPWLSGRYSGATILRPSREKEWIIKMRYPASPFGFGFKQSDLSPKQLGILGALGLSKI